MKKRFSLYALILGLIFVSLASIEFVSSENVCGQFPNSVQGYGQVNIFGVIYSCSNFEDGLCPEDYEDYNNSAIFGSCLRCHDPDCTGNVNGTVYSHVGAPIARATVKALPIRYDVSAPSMEKTVITTANGGFSLVNVTTGKYYFSASQEGFDTQLIEVSVTRKNTTTGVLFNLANGTCFEDCTNSYGRCNAQCDGLNFSNNGVCGFYNKTIATLCDNRLKGTDVIIPGTSNGTYARFVNCCEGVPYVKYYRSATVSTSSIKNLAKIEKIVKYNDQPVRVVIAYWPNLE